jgi:hypothetical protein
MGNFQQPVIAAVCGIEHTKSDPHNGVDNSKVGSCGGVMDKTWGDTVGGHVMDRQRCPLVLIEFKKLADRITAISFLQNNGRRT